MKKMLSLTWLLLLECIFLCSCIHSYWTNAGKDSFNTKLSPAITSPTSGWRIVIGDFDQGSFALTNSGELLFPYYDDQKGCIQKVSLLDGKVTGNVCWRSGDVPRAGLIPKTDEDSYIFLEKADGLRLLKISTMQLQKWTFPDFSYMQNYVLYEDNVIFAARGMCPDGSYEVCLNVSSVKIGAKQENWKVLNIPCSSENCFLTQDDESPLAFLLDDSNLYQSNRTNHVWKINSDTGHVDSFPVPVPTFKETSKRVGIGKTGFYFVQRSVDLAYRAYGFSKTSDSLMWKTALMSTHEDTDGDCSDVMISLDENYVYALGSFNGIEFTNNTLFVLDASSGSIVSQHDFAAMFEFYNSCSKMNLLSDGRVIVWCLGVFATDYVVVGPKGNVLKHEKSPFGKAQLFADPVSDGSNNVYIQETIFMDNLYLAKVNFGK